MAVILSNTTVVGVDRPMKALFLQKPYIRKKLSKFLSKIVYSTKLRAHIQYVYIEKAKYQIAPTKAVVGVTRLVHALSYNYKGK